MTKQFKTCPKCGRKLLKNGIRNEAQRFRCSNPSCNFSVTSTKKTPQKQKDAFKYMYYFINTIQKLHRKHYEELPKIFKKIKTEKQDIRFTINDPSQIDKINSKSCIIIAEDNALHVIQIEDLIKSNNKILFPKKRNRRKD